MSDEDWHGNLETRARGLEKADLLVDFVTRAMTADPEARLTAEQALDHDFLKLTSREEKNAQTLLGTVAQ